MCWPQQTRADHIFLVSSNAAVPTENSHAAFKYPRKSLALRTTSHSHFHCRNPNDIWFLGSFLHNHVLYRVIKGFACLFGFLLLCQAAFWG